MNRKQYPKGCGKGFGMNRMKVFSQMVVGLIAVCLWLGVIGCFISVGWDAIYGWGRNNGSMFFIGLLFWAVALLIFFAPFALMEERRD